MTEDPTNLLNTITNYTEKISLTLGEGVSYYKTTKLSVVDGPPEVCPISY